MAVIGGGPTGQVCSPGPWGPLVTRPVSWSALRGRKSGLLSRPVDDLPALALCLGCCTRGGRGGHATRTNLEHSHFQCSPESTRVSQSQPETIRVHQSYPETATRLNQSPTVPQSARVNQSQRETTRVHQSLPESTRQPESTRVSQSPPE